MDTVKKLLSFVATTKPQAQFHVSAVILNAEIRSSNDLYGCLLPLGAFETQALAEQHAETLKVVTGMMDLIVHKYGDLYPLLLVPSKVPKTGEEAVQTLHEMEKVKFEEREEKRKEIEAEIDADWAAEADPTKIEHLIRYAYLMLKYMSSWQNYQDLEKKTRALFEENRVVFCQHVLAFPDQEEVWLDLLKEKLMKRGEETLATYLEGLYQQNRTFILTPLTQSSTGRNDVKTDFTADQPPESDQVLPATPGSRSDDLGPPTPLNRGDGEVAE